MAKAKRSTKPNKKSVKRAAPKSSTTHGLEHDFILMAGGGFIVLVLIIITIFH